MDGDENGTIMLEKVATIPTWKVHLLKERGTVQSSDTVLTSIFAWRKNERRAVRMKRAQYKWK